MDRGGCRARAADGKRRGSSTIFKAAHWHSASAIKSVAVLPLKNLTGGTNDEYFADGLTEGLIGSLSKLDGLKVSGSRANRNSAPSTNRSASAASGINASSSRSKRCSQITRRR